MGIASGEPWVEREGKNFHLYIPAESGHFQVTLWGVGDDFCLQSSDILPRLQAIEKIAKERISGAGWLALLGEEGSSALLEGVSPKDGDFAQLKRKKGIPVEESTLEEALEGIRDTLLGCVMKEEAPPEVARPVTVTKEVGVQGLSDNRSFLEVSDQAATEVEKQFPRLFCARTHITSLVGDKRVLQGKSREVLERWDASVLVRAEFDRAMRRLTRDPKSTAESDQQVKEWLVAIARRIALRMESPSTLEGVKKFQRDILERLTLFFMFGIGGHSDLYEELLLMWKIV